MPNIEEMRLPERRVKVGDKTWKTYYPCAYLKYSSVKSKRWELLISYMFQKYLPRNVIRDNQSFHFE